ncbi:MAG: LamG domain-containing protein, partial [Patescibacteria group bacterium]|nr:LamG domain-containing protein [Patescibacteria group bacterium]
GGVVQFGGNAALQASTVQPQDGVFTIAFWALRSSNHTSGNDGLFTMHDGDSANKNIGGWVNGSDQVWGRVRDTGDKSPSPNNRVRMPGDGMWTHLVFIGDGTTYEVVQDGARVGNAVAYSGVNLRNITTLWIGRQGSESWRGCLDDFRVYSRALSDVDISELVFSVQDEPAVKVDFGTVPGFVAFKAAEGGANLAQTRSYHAPFAVNDVAAITVSGYTLFRDSAAVDGGPYEELSPIVADGVLRDSPGTMALTIENLQFGVYELTTHHHATEYAGASFDIRVHDSVGLDQEIASGLRVTSGTGPADVTASTFRFVTSGDPVVVGFSTGDADVDTHFSLNALDLRLVNTLYRRETVLAVDFNHRGTPESTNPSVTQAGFDEFLLASGTGGVGTFGDLDVTLSSVRANLDDRRRTSPINGGDFTQQELLLDFVFSVGTTTDTGLDILVEGLEPDAIYEVSIWAFDRDSSGNRNALWYANGVLAEDYSFNGSTLPTTDDDYAFSFLAYANAAGDLLINGRRAEAGASPAVFINALRLTLVVPEPGTILLSFATLMSVLIRRSRQKRK